MKNKAKNVYGYSIAQAREALGKIKVNLEFLSIDRSYKCLMFSSSVAGEGKSTVVGNLAISFAASDKKVLLIDADLRHPTQHRLFNVVNKIGLSDIIINNSNWRDYVLNTNIEKLDIITAGRIPPNPSELLGSNKMGELIKEVKKEYDMILVDNSPILLVPDPISISKHMDGIILVARYNFTIVDAIINTQNALKIAGVPLIGAILNNVSKDSDYYKYGKKYTYGYGAYYKNDSEFEKG